MDKTMSFAAVAREIHENAVAHGWWDGEREIDEIYALIHSEWSEALEEARAGNPDRWYKCRGLIHPYCTKETERECPLDKVKLIKDADKCAWRDPKPEGICVELIDGVIRILDYLSYKGDMQEYEAQIVDWFMDMDDGSGWARDKQALSVGALIKNLHNVTAGAGDMRVGSAAEKGNLIYAAIMVWTWIKGRGLDPMELLIEKHEYNKTRPYKHGKEF